MAKDASDTIYSMADANEALADSFGKVSFEWNNQIKSSRAWMMANRLFVGSGFWKISNKLKGINDGFILYHNNQKNAIKKQKEMTKGLNDFYKAAKKVPKHGMFDKKNKAGVKKIIDTEEFQNRLDFNERLKGAGGLKGRSAMQETMKQYDEMIKIQQDTLEAQLEGMIKEEKYKEMGIFGKLARKWDNLKAIISGLPKFIWNGTKLFLKFLWGMMWFVIFAPLVMKVLRFAYKYFQNLTPEQRQKWANARDKAVEIMVAVKDLIVAIWEGRWWDVMSIYFNRIVIPIFKGIYVILEMLFNWSVKKLGELWGYISSGRLAEDIGSAIDKYMGDKAEPAKKFLNIADAIAQTVNPYYAGARLLHGSHWTQKAWRGDKLGTFASGGTMTNSGMAIVGEGGPELVSLPGGAKIHSNFASRGMGGTTINVNVSGRVGASDMEIRDIANKVAREINTHMNRTSSSTVRFG